MKKTLKRVSANVMGVALIMGGVYLMIDVWNIIWWQFSILLAALVFGIMFIIAALEDT